MTQVKLNTEGKKFKGRGRVMLEGSLETARTVLENARTKDELDAAISDLTKRGNALEEYLQSLW